MSELLFVAAILAGAVAAGLLARLGRSRAHEARALSRIEAKLDAIMKHQGIPFDPYAEIPPKVIDALQRGQKIEAIREYRLATGRGTQGSEGANRGDMASRRASRLAVVLALAAAAAHAQTTPAELQALAATSGVKGSIAAWCRAEFRAGDPGAFAVAVASDGGGGRYLALDADGRATELATYTRTPGLACHTSDAAKTLDATIKESETLAGHVRPRWKTTVVCGFTDDTSATCWQYSPPERAFVKVGQWVT